MNLSVFGLGYVGSVCAACLAAEGHTVIGVDVNRDKVNLVRAGLSPVAEPGLAQLLADGVAQGRLTATTDALSAVLASDASLVCVGTPSRSSGGVDLRQVMKVMREIGEGIWQKQQDHTVILRSTVPPGTSQRCRETIQEFAHHMPVDFFYNPEFLREGKSIEEFRHPALTVIGSLPGIDPDNVSFLWENRGGSTIFTSVETAELVKYACNAFHATKVAFANEIGRVAHGFGIDGQEVMDILCQDHRLNISSAYLRPGFAFGGSCLPKDVRAIITEGFLQGVEMPLLDGVVRSNAAHLADSVRLVLEAVAESGKKSPKILLVGLAFKPGTDDLRESPSVLLAEQLLERYLDLTIYDPFVQSNRLIGNNRLFVEYELPEAKELLTYDLANAMQAADIVVVSQAMRETLQALKELYHPDQLLIDLSGELSDFANESNYRSRVGHHKSNLADLTTLRMSSLSSGRPVAG